MDHATSHNGLYGPRDRSLTETKQWGSYIEIQPSPSSRGYSCRWSGRNTLQTLISRLYNRLSSLCRR